MFNSGNCSYWREWWRGRHRVTRFEFLRDFFFLWPRQNFEAVKMCLFVFWFRSCGKSVAIGCIARAHRQPIPYLTTETKLNDNSPMLSFFIKFQHLRVHELCYRVVCFSTEVFFSFWKFVERYASHLAAIEKKRWKRIGLDCRVAICVCVEPWPNEPYIICVELARAAISGRQWVALFRIGNVFFSLSPTFFFLFCCSQLHLAISERGRGRGGGTQNINTMHKTNKTQIKWEKNERRKKTAIWRRGRARDELISDFYVS